MEKLLARLDRKYGRYAPEGMILWLVGLSGVLHLLVFARPGALWPRQCFERRRNHQL